MAANQNCYWTVVGNNGFKLVDISIQSQFGSTWQFVQVLSRKGCPVDAIGIDVAGP